MPDPQEMPGAGAGEGAPPIPAVPGAAPSDSPGMKDQVPAGEIEKAKANVQIAVQVLEQTLPMLGSGSEEGRAVLAALTTLHKKFAGKKSQDLAPAELMQMMSTMPEQFKSQIAAQQGGGGTPPQGA